jgi:prepilin-type processing-associated H-X9-DG protein
MACQAHIAATGRFPTGGWGFLWAGDPDRGNDRRQPGGWIYNVLPYIEQQALHDLAAGETGDERLMSTTQMCQTPLEIMHCPSRRKAKLYPYWQFSSYPMRNTMYLEESAKCDYAANGGDSYLEGVEGPQSFAEADAGDYQWHDTSKSTGVVFQISEVTPSQVLDGLAKTYLVGEKYVPTDRYKDGVHGGDDQTIYVGHDTDTIRWAMDKYRDWVLPLRDAKATDSKEKRYRFGSAHPDGINMAYCDGSVRVVSYAIEIPVHRAATNRKDAETLGVDHP